MLTLRNKSSHFAYLVSRNKRDFTTFGVIGAVFSSVLAVKASLVRLNATYYYDPSDDSHTVKERLDNMQFKSILLRSYAQQQFLKTNERDPAEVLLNQIQHDKNNLVNAYHRERRKRQRVVAYSWIALLISGSALPFLPYESTILRPLFLSTTSVLATSELAHLGSKTLGGMLSGIAPKNSYVAFGAATAAVVGLVSSPFSIAASVFSFGPNVFYQQALIYTQLICGATVYGLYYLPILSKDQGILPTGIEKSSTSSNTGKFSLTKTLKTIEAHAKDLDQSLRYNTRRFIRWLKMAKNNSLRGFRYILYSDYFVGRISSEEIVNSIRDQLMAIRSVKEGVNSELQRPIEQDQKIEVIVDTDEVETAQDHSLIYMASYAFKAFISTADSKIGSQSNGIDVWGFVSVNDGSRHGYLLFNGWVQETVPVTREDLKDVKFETIFGTSSDSKSIEIIISKELPKGAQILRTEMHPIGGRKIYWKRGNEEKGVSGWKPASTKVTFSEVYFIPAGVVEAGILDRQDMGAYTAYKSLYRVREFIYSHPLAKKLIF
jgi:hypothetical protein